MGGRGGSGRSSAAVVQMPAFDANGIADLDIRDAYEDALAANPNSVAGVEWVSLTRLRTALAVRGWDRDRQDREILRFVRERKGILNPESNQKVLSPRDRADAITMGGEQKHIFMVKR